ncbi:ABC transporter ATP-binding protein [Candidatus Korarchaeum cryptofilum]|jgi:energy-coupling factor transport system ATP-binding protein|uniref:ABC-type cobalt transport system, ATPase component n=1 Tax=Korarchaeum cryptofilum (strain OPF8) TaxID=374847 RepID=B1L3R5_KORCO|nr:energy-coupling factor transporter ATPase [Candidatus Korarchaeum cryptofilum]ACB07094.1 ABC-type cobalt transport system, ATPase component [Candidatus Korarchaeum cryptofilum OPF8]
MPERVIELEEVTFTYPDGTVALKNISFFVEEGEAVAVVGENGAGKTTLCYLLSGVIPHIYGGTIRGKVSVAGIQPKDSSMRDLSRQVSIVLQDPDSQIFSPTVFMEVAFGPSNLGLSKEEIVANVKWALEATGLSGLEERSPDELSGGQKQRLVLASALAMRSKVLVLDEPTSQLDPVGVREVMATLKELKRRGVTMVITTHQTEEIAEIADKVIVLKDGNLLAIGSPKEIFSNVELMERAGVKAPDVAILTYELTKRGLSPEEIPINELEANKVLYKFIRDGKIRVSGKLSFEQKRNERAIIEVRDLTFEYPGRVRALDDVNLTVYEGDFLGVIGMNGSGKSTLVKTMIGLLKPQHGKVLFKGEDVSKFTVGELARKIGLILQNPDYQLFTISAIEEVMFGLRNIGVKGEEARKLALEILDMVGLKEKAEYFPFKLSFGERRLLAAAATLALNPEVIILDEPTTAQDYRGRYLLADLAKNLHERGKTIIMITHDMDLIAKYANRVIVMTNGKIIMDGDPHEVFNDIERLRQAGVMPPQITRLAISMSQMGIPSQIIKIEEFLEVVEVVK